jgi:hypothetical protein
VKQINFSWILVFEVQRARVSLESTLRAKARLKPATDQEIDHFTAF